MSTDKKIQAAIAEACKTKTLQEVAVEFNCSRNTITAICERAGVTPTMISKVKRTKVEQYIKDNPESTIMGVAEVMQASKAMVVDCFARLKIKPIQPMGEATVQSLTIVAELQGGATQSDLARKYSISRQRVQQLHKRAKDAGMYMPVNDPDARTNLNNVPPLPDVIQPGNWLYKTSSDGPEVYTEEMWVCSCAGECKTEWDEANGRAIACLPNLLKQLNIATAAMFAVVMQQTALTSADRDYLSRVVQKSNRLINQALGQDTRE